MRILKLETPQLGTIQLMVLTDHDPELKGIEDWVPNCNEETLNHALYGYCKPLIDQLGPDPIGRLRLIPKIGRNCADWDRCAIRGSHCKLLDSKLPWCYIPKDYEQLAWLVQQWHKGYWVVRIQNG